MANKKTGEALDCEETAAVSTGKPRLFLDLVRDRVSIRRFLDKPVGQEEILRCLEAARLAPSAENSQPWRFLVVDNPVVRKAFAAKAFSGVYAVTRFAAAAPVLVLILAELNLVTHRLGRWIQNIPFHLIDVGIAGEHLVLQAEEIGLGTCWIGWFDVRKTRKFFRIPRKYRIVALLALGYPERRPSRPRKRKTMEEIASFNRLGR